MKLFPLFALLLVIAFGCNQTNRQETTLWIGTYTGGSSEGIYNVDFNTVTGELTNLKLAFKVDNPAYIDLSENNLWAISENEGGSLISFSKTGKSLTLLNSASSMGRGSCYVDSNGDMVAVANYGSGDGVVYSVKADGSIGDQLFNYRHAGKGPNEARQKSPHAHCAIFSPEGSYLYVVDLGTDQVIGYPTNGEQKGVGFVALQLEPGDGPRHLSFHPNQPFAFVINELAGTVVSTMFGDDGILTQLDRKSTMPEGYDGHTQSSDIHVSEDGRFLYASNRGHNSLATFSIDKSGKLALVDHTSVEGDWPRNFTLSPDGRFLLVANRRTNNITVFSIDATTGLLKFTGNELAMTEPVCLKFD